MFEKYLNGLDPKVRLFYEKKLNKLTEEQKGTLYELTNKMKNAGCRNPFSWAFSEITEGIPQFGRFLMLKKLFEIANNVDRAMEFAQAYANNYDALEEDVLTFVDKPLLKQYLSAYNRGMISRFVELIEGNRDADKDNLNWVLLKTDAKGIHTEQIIQGLHEDILEFETEIDQD